jgi:hypothetical protein
MLALGVSIPWARSGPADFTPLLAMLCAILILRFVVGSHLTAMRTMLAVACGALWATCIERWGIVVPTAFALLVIAGLRSIVGRSRAA